MGIDNTGFYEAVEKSAEIEIKKKEIELRDWFAGMALQGLLAQETEDWNYTEIYKLTLRAYEISDAMLKEREKWVPTPYP